MQEIHLQCLQEGGPMDGFLAEGISGVTEIMLRFKSPRAAGEGGSRCGLFAWR